MDRLQPEKPQAVVEEKKAGEPLASRAGKMNLRGAATRVAEKISDPVILGSKDPVTTKVESQFSPQKDQDLLNAVTTSIRGALTHPVANPIRHQRHEVDVQRLDQVREQRKIAGIQSLRVQQELERQQQAKLQSGELGVELRHKADVDIRRAATQTPATSSRAVQDAIRNRIVRNNTDAVEQQNVRREGSEAAARQSALEQRNSAKELEQQQGTKDLVMGSAGSSKPREGLTTPSIGEVVKIELTHFSEQRQYGPPKVSPVKEPLSSGALQNEQRVALENRLERVREMVRIQQDVAKSNHFEPVAEEEARGREA